MLYPVPESRISAVASPASLSKRVDLHNGTVLIRRTFSHHRVLAWTKTGRERVSNFLHPVSVDGDWRPVDMGLLARLANVQRMDPERSRGQPRIDLSRI